MLSYQHQYHAGNFADIHKHLCLIATLSIMHKKEKPISVIDTHAGNGLYDLHSEAANKTSEAKQGIQAIWPSLATSNEQELQANKLLTTYHKIISELNKKEPSSSTHHINNIRYYPGSPLVALSLARPQDNWVGFELHPQSHQALTKALAPHQHYQLHQRDALEGLLASIPLTNPRTITLIDPSYEIKDEYLAIPKTIHEALKIKRQSVILLWYPLLNANRHEKMIQTIAQQLSADQQLLISEWQPTQPSANTSELGMKGSGMLIINPPWQIDTLLKQSAQHLAEQSAFSELTYTQQLN